MTKWFERRGHPIGTCNECLAWGHFFARRLCAACYMVDHKDRWPRAKCESCRRRVRVRRGYCRLCWDNARTLAHDTGNPKITAVDQIAEVRHQQLFFANMAALAAPSRSGTRRSRAAEQRGPRIPAAPRKKTGQLTLFRRNNRGTLVSVQRLEKPANAPETVAAARQVLRRISEAHGWTKSAYYKTRKGLDLALCRRRPDHLLTAAHATAGASHLGHKDRGGPSRVGRLSR